MATPKHRDIWQYGDFQTPDALATEVCTVLTRRGIAAPAVLEPTCGKGAFLAAAATAFPNARTRLGVELNDVYVAEASERLGEAGQVERGDFFAVDWDAVLSRDGGPWLVLGNPPWVTNAELGILNSTNLPVKSNFQGHQGLDAITGKANFDISEWMLLQQLDWLKKRCGWIAMLVKTSVARKVLRQAWRQRDEVGRAAIYKVDAMRHFGAAVDACLFVLPVKQGEISQDCDVYDSLSSDCPQSTIGFHDGVLVSNVAGYTRYRHLIGNNRTYVWRSGVKHDCSKIMELSHDDDGHLVNGLGERVSIERDFVYPMLKSSDIAKGRVSAGRFMIVPQREIGEDTSGIAETAPRTWAYLTNHAAKLDGRGSVIYRGKPRFSIFGVGSYTFAPWKVAISGFYKNLKFTKIGPNEGRPVVLDDTIYFLSCKEEIEADFIMSLIQSEPYEEFLGSMVFHDEKRPITADILKRISLERVADELGLGAEYSTFAGEKGLEQQQLALG